MTKCYLSPENTINFIEIKKGGGGGDTIHPAKSKDILALRFYK